jgi:hypothetical protein
VNDWIQRLLYGVAAIRAKKEMQELQDKLKEQTKAQQERADKTNTTLQELQANMNVLAHYKAAAKNVSLKHIITTLVPTCKKKIKDHFKFFHKSVPKNIPLSKVPEEDEVELGSSVKHEPRKSVERENVKLSAGGLGEVKSRKVPDAVAKSHAVNKVDEVYKEEEVYKAEKAKGDSVKTQEDRRRGIVEEVEEVKKVEKAKRVKPKEIVVSQVRDEVRVAESSKDKKVSDSNRDVIDKRIHKKPSEQNVVEVSEKGSAQRSDLTRDTKANKEQTIPSYIPTSKEHTKTKPIQHTKVPSNTDLEPLVEKKEMDRISISEVSQTRDTVPSRTQHKKEALKSKDTTTANKVKKVSKEFSEHVIKDTNALRLPSEVRNEQPSIPGVSVNLKSEEVVNENTKLPETNAISSADLLREQIGSPMSAVSNILAKKKNMGIKELIDSTKKFKKALYKIIKRKLKELEKEIINSSIIAQAKRTANVLSGNKSFREGESEEAKLKCTSLGINFMIRILKRKISDYIKTVTQYKSLREVQLMLDKLEGEENDLRGARIIKEIITDKVRILFDAFNSLTFIKAIQEEKMQLLSSQTFPEAIKEESMESSSVQYQCKGAASRGPDNPIEQTQLETEDKNYTSINNFGELVDLRTEEAFKHKDERIDSNDDVMKPISGLQISTLPGINTFTSNQEERIIPYEVHIERSFSSRKSPEIERVQGYTSKRLDDALLDYYNAEPINIVGKDDVMKENRGRRSNVHMKKSSKSSAFDRFLLNPRSSIQNDISIKEEQKEDDSPKGIKHPLVRNMSEISPIKPLFNKEERKTPEGPEELKEAYTSALNTPINQIMGKGGAPDSDNNSDIGMAEPIELEAFLLPLKERRAMDKPLVGRFDHKQFIGNFTKCFMKYHTLMVEEERKRKESMQPQRKHHNLPSESQRSVKNVKGSYPVQEKSKVSFASTSREYIIPHVKDYDISQEFRARLKKQPFFSKFAKKTVEVQDRSKMNNISLKPPTTCYHHHRKSSDSISINPLDRSSGASSRNAVEDRLPANYIEMNKKFIKELSNLNGEINSKYNCMTQMPRLKVKNPELVLQMVKYKAQLQDISRSSLSPSQSSLSKRNDDKISSRGFQETRRYN